LHEGAETAAAAAAAEEEEEEEEEEGHGSDGAAGEARDAAKNELMLLRAAKARFASELTPDMGMRSGSGAIASSMFIASIFLSKCTLLLLLPPPPPPPPPPPLLCVPDV
jgi:hypothetical protein